MAVTGVPNLLIPFPGQAKIPRMTTPSAHTDGEPKKKKWPWIVGIIVAIGLFGSLIDSGDDDTETTAEEATPTVSNTESATPTTSAVEESTMEATTEATDNGMGVGETFEQWYLSQYSTPTWEYICDEFGGWQCNVRAVGTMDGSNDTIVIVTNLSEDNPEGVRRAEQAAAAVKNQASLNETIPQSVKDNAQFVQVRDLQGNTIANDWLEFAE